MFGEAGCESAIEVVLEGERALDFLEVEEGELLLDERDKLLVFFWFHGARAVDEGASWFEQRDGTSHEGGLLERHANEVFLCEAPTDIHAAAQDPGIGARDIEEDAVKGGLEKGAAGFGLKQEVEGVDLDAGDAEPCDVLAEAQGARFKKLCGEELPSILHLLSEVSGFTSRCGTGIQDAFSWLGVEQIGGEEGAGILGVAEALGEPTLWEFPYFEYASGAWDAFGFGVRGGEGFGGGSEGIGAEEGFGGLVIPLAEALGGFSAETLEPTFYEEIGVAEADAEGCLFDGGAEVLCFPAGAAQDGVDERAGAFCEAHGFKDCGVGGDSGVKELIEPHAEEGLGCGVEFSLAQDLNPVVESAKVAQDAVEELCEEAAVCGGGFEAFGEVVEDFVREGASFFPFREGLKAKGARGADHRGRGRRVVRGV